MNAIETHLSQTLNFQFIHEHLFTSGQPTAEQLQQIKEYGVNTVINLALSNSNNHLVNEDHICLELGLNYIQVPISWDTPSDDQCLLVLDMIDHLVQEQTIWVHCSENYLNKSRADGKSTEGQMSIKSIPCAGDSGGGV